MVYTADIAAHAYISLVVTENSYDAASNTSVVGWDANFIARDGFSYNGGYDYNCYINGTQVGVASASYNTGVNGTIHCGSGTISVPHNADGSKTINVSQFTDIAQYGGVTASGTLALTDLTTTPTVTTTAASSVESSQFTTGGNVTWAGNGTVSSRGVCYNTTGTPTISDSKVTSGSGTGSFSSTITGLDAGTTYYVRAYATNEIATGYGSQITVTTTSNGFLPILSALI